MLVGAPGGGAATGGALEQPALEQVGLVHVLDRVLLLTDRHRERRQAHGSAAELLADHAQDLAIQAVEALVIDLQQIECCSSCGGGDYPVALHLNKVAHTLEQAVRHSRSATAALRNRARPAVVDLDVQ